MNGGADTSARGMEPIRVRTILAAGPNRRIIAGVRGHEVVMDVSRERGGEDAGPTPPECLAMALGGCVLNICRVIAMERRIVLEDLRVTVNGDIDPTRACGMRTDKRAGFSSLSVQVEMTSKLTGIEKESFLRELIHRCPICDSIDSPTPLRVEFAE